MTEPEHRSAPPEVLGSGPSEDRPPRRIGLVLGGLLVLMLLVAGADEVLARREVAALLEATSAATATARYAEERVRGVETYASPQLYGAGTPASVRADLEALVRSEAAAQAPTVAAAADRVAAVRVLPWHDGTRGARTAVAQYLQVRADALAAFAEGAAADGPVDPDPARRALLEVLSGAEARARVDQALTGAR